MRYIAALAVLLALSCAKAPGVSVAERTGPDLAEDLFSKTVALVQDRGGDWKTYCAGVWVGPKSILTAAHCTRQVTLALDFPQEPLFIATREDLKEGKPRAALLVKRDTETDLALLEVGTAPAHPIAALRQSPILPGEPCFIVGHPSGFTWTFTNGAVSGIRENRIQTWATVWFGNSGGGMFDAQGNLMGIASTLHGSLKYAFFIHRDAIRAFL